MLFFVRLCRSPRATLFPYTTLFRSRDLQLPLPDRLAGLQVEREHEVVRRHGARVVHHAVAPNNLVFAFDLKTGDRKSTRLNSSHTSTSYAVLSLKKKPYYLLRREDR